MFEVISNFINQNQISVSVLSIIPFIVFFSREAIMNLLTKKIQHRFDNKLENLKSELSLNNNKIIEELKSNYKFIENSVSSIAKAQTEQQKFIYERKIKSIEVCWEVYLKNQSFINNEYVLDDVIGTEFFNILTEQMKLSDLNNDVFLQNRIFIGEYLFSLFLAYSSIQLISYANYRNEKYLKKFTIQDLLESEFWKKLLDTEIEEVKTFGGNRFSNLKSILNGKIILEIDKIVSGEKETQINIQQSFEIHKQVQELSLNINNTKS